MKINGKRKKFVSFNTWGTVKSGDPTKTTLGNTIRVLTYIEYICFLAGITEDQYFKFVAGDDVLIMMEND